MRTKGSRVRKGSRPITVNGKVPPRRVANASRRPREYLTPEEVERLITAAHAGHAVLAVLLQPPGARAMAVEGYVADAVINLGTIDIVLGDVDR